MTLDHQSKHGVGSFFPLAKITVTEIEYFSVSVKKLRKKINNNNNNKLT